MKVNICGIPHDVEIRDDTFTSNVLLSKPSLPMFVLTIT